MQKGVRVLETDKHLIYIFAGGDDASAYQKLKSDVAAKVYSCSTQVKGEELDDIIQDAALKLYLSIDRYDSKKAAVSTFRDHIITNVLIDRIRRWRAHKSQVLTWDEVDETEDGCEQVDFDMDFERWFRTLLPHEKKIVRMRLDGKKNCVIADELGCSNASITAYRKVIQKKWNSFFYYGGDENHAI
ncbi:RNA polymerase sigma factor (sigma-70 family) [Aneurinibacillus soli]|uniref:RNA polymerase sigma factor SigS n=1 Tax=Aneurinibacillus soli TaxID=1500254 RepID=A0A0U5AWW7_9BACL|nr:RNA polymerase sigma factor (sigma-70 family) [Aneurinibacillus soli]BAU28218.1 RNA polymerase sigma factor [Aneurinibacillus soli]